MTLTQLNQAQPPQAQDAFMQCCTSSTWVSRMVADRPYANAAQLASRADANWQHLQESDYLQAFEGHPKIGDMDSLAKKYATTKALASGEQAGVKSANAGVLQALAEGNQNYLAKFGFIFIVCASGKSAAEMLALLQARLTNDRTTELNIAAEEQRKIFHLRLEKLL